MDDLTRRVRIYFGPCFSLLADALNPEAHEMQDADRIKAIDTLVVGFYSSLRRYRSDAHCQTAIAKARRSDLQADTTDSPTEH